MEKRGLSDVPITIIMVSILIFLIGILWVVFVNVFNSNPGEVLSSFKDLSSDLKIESVTQNEDGSLSVSVKKSQGKARLSKIILFISDDKTTEVIERDSNLGSNEKSTLQISKSDLENLNFIRKVSVVPVFDAEETSWTIEQATDTFEISTKDILKNIGAVSWYSFEENLLDGIGITNGVVSDTYSFSEGKYGKSLSLNGVDEYVDYGGYSVFDGKSSFAISFWIYRDGGNEFANNGGIFTRGANNSQSPWIYGYKNTRAIFAQFRTDEATADCSLGTNPISTKQWSHIVFVWDGKECKFYENGRKTNSDPTKGLSLVNIDQTTFVGKSNDEEYFHGRIDELIIFERSLSEDEVKIVNSLNPN